MALELSRFVANIEPERTVLFFGSGSSIPSGAPSVVKLIEAISGKFHIDSEGLTLSEISTLAEKNISNRKELILLIRKLIANVKATGGILNLPLYHWRSLYTTNYDTLIEQVYKVKAKELVTYSSNYDFSQSVPPTSQKLYKLHGTIEKDIVDGNLSRLILSEDDYVLAKDYREQIFNRFESDIDNSKLIIVGYSLSDSHIKDIISKVTSAKSETYAHREITILIYTRDDNRAKLLENRGIQVVFGSIDEFFAELSKSQLVDKPVLAISSDPFDVAPVLNPITRNVLHAIDAQSPNFSSMFNGWPANYGDVKAGFTFERTISREISSIIESNSVQSLMIIGASGVGKTTAARQILSTLVTKGVYVWEHDVQSPLMPDEWRKVAVQMAKNAQRGVIFIDDASTFTVEINRLVDYLALDGLTSLSLLLVSSKSSWAPRIKSTHLYRNGKEFNLKRLDSAEIERLLSLVDNKAPVSALVENSFKGFSQYERRRRLVERCESDFFVCLKNVFASEKFDDIILREYAALDENGRDVYRLVAALQSAGIVVHRQLIIRLLGISASHISSVLSSLSDVVVERSVDTGQGIYAWIGRHQVISEIIAKYKYSDQVALYELLAKVIQTVSATYQIEVRGLRELCSSNYGVPKISDKRKQNVLYRMMMSVVPGERVPRHRLIRNLINIGEFDEASTEIRIFETDFREDGPVARYKIDLMLARAVGSPGLLDEDRVAILTEARDYANFAIDRFGDNKYVLYAYAQVGVHWYKFTGESNVYDAAILELQAAEVRIADPDITTMISRISKQYSAVVEAH